MMVIIMIDIVIIATVKWTAKGDKNRELALLEYRTSGKLTCALGKLCLASAKPGGTSAKRTVLVDEIYKTRPVDVTTSLFSYFIFHISYFIFMVKYFKEGCPSAQAGYQSLPPPNKTLVSHIVIFRLLFGQINYFIRAHVYICTDVEAFITGNFFYWNEFCRISNKSAPILINS